ncbi:MAG: NAD(P)H-hydrate dehydratase [Aigarchaeota archaeon]|nr:NAD(P)H-hydrate dehydratase [Aigarchaeota archaeon]MDW8092901.1 NAD(P)H-hydrate dehydratase [Nitrososphaerota archaeon]
MAEVDDSLVAKVIPPRRRKSRKGENGSVMVIGGSYLYHGAPTLTALAAYRAGADLVYLSVPEVISVPIRAISPALIVIPFSDTKLTMGVVRRIVKNVPRVDAVAIGPGLSIADTAPLLTLIKELLGRGMRLVLDASALIPQVLEIISSHNVVLTPHAGEFKRLFGVEPSDDMEERCGLVRDEAKKHGVTLLVKGAVDVISDGDSTYINRRGSPSMTVGGTGDVLTGIVATLLAKGLNSVEAAAAAVYVNCVAGEEVTERMGLHILPTDVIEELPNVMKRYDRIID